LPALAEGLLFFTVVFFAIDTRSLRNKEVRVIGHYMRRLSGLPVGRRQLGNIGEPRDRVA
jgi:hypothetical protein